MTAPTVADARWMDAALALAERARGLTGRNPPVGCVIVRDGIVVGRGWTQPGGRPHAEEMALVAAGDAARGATAYVTLEPCAHPGGRGPACAPSLMTAGVARCVVAHADPDPRTDGRGVALLRAAGVSVAEGVATRQAARVMGGFLTRQRLGRPHVTLKLALSLDGCVAMADGSSRWITGPEARAHAHLERAKVDAILVGGGTFRSDAPALDVRLPRLETRSPARLLLTRGAAPSGWRAVADPIAIGALDDVDTLLVEGGPGAASAFLRHGLVDRLMLYRAPILVGGRPALSEIGLANLGDAHGRFRLCDRRMLGSDTLEVYEATPCSPAS